jgi:nicotinamide-nucleotide amidase
MAERVNLNHLLQAARAKGYRIATAESCTGGMVAVALTDMPGASDVFDRGFVTYSNQAKEQLLAVPAATLATHGAVSEAVARAMAKGALDHSDATLAVAITGIAGPGGSAHKPEGRVCFGFATRGQDAWAETIDFGALGRSAVRRAATEHALGMLMAAVSQ